MRVDSWFLAYFILGFKMFATPYHTELCCIHDRIDIPKMREIVQAGDIVCGPNAEPIDWPLYDPLPVPPGYEYIEDVFKDFAPGCNNWFFFGHRFCGKSSMDVTHTIQLILRYPWLRSTLWSGKEGEAKFQCRTLAGTLETNNDLRYYNPDIFWMDPYVEGAEPWRNDAIKVRRDVRPNHYEDEPTMRALSLYGGETGTHCDLGIMEDLENEKNAASEILIAETKRRYSELWGNIEGKAVVKGYGTFHVESGEGVHGEIYQKWQARKRNQEPQIWQVHIRGPRYTEEDDWPLPPGVAPGDFINPHKLNEDILRKLEDNMEPDQLCTQFYMKPAASGRAKFDIKDLRYYEVLGEKDGVYKMHTWAKAGDGSNHEEGEREVRLNTIITADYATAINRRACYTGIPVVSVDNDKGRWVRAYKRQRYPNLFDSLPDVVQFYNIFRPVVRFGYEADNAAAVLAVKITEEVGPRCAGMEIVKIPTRRVGAVNKTSRIVSDIGWLLRNHRLYILESMQELVYDIARFGLPSAKIDLVDAISMVGEIATYPEQITHITPEVEMAERVRNFFLHKAPPGHEYVSREELARFGGELARVAGMVALGANYKHGW